MRLTTNAYSVAVIYDVHRVFSVLMPHGHMHVWQRRRQFLSRSHAIAVFIGAAAFVLLLKRGDQSVSDGARQRL